jgi:hypothetical protein
MSDIIGMIGQTAIEKYSVLQVNDGDSRGWLDFSTLREPWELATAIRMVDERGGVNGFRHADYRIVQRGEPVYVWENRIKVGDFTFQAGDRLEILRLEDEQDIAEGWQLVRPINTVADAQVALERCSRLREPDDKRHHRVTTADGAIRLGQLSRNALRLSGILWTCDPLRLPGVASDRYDRYAARIMEMASEWDTQIVPILNELNASETLRDRIHSFLALTI